jgi:hypothetical protein
MWSLFGACYTWSELFSRRPGVHPLIEKHRPDIVEICRRYGIHRLEVFGSAARGVDFDPERSDADFLVEFSPETSVGLADFFGVKSELEALLSRGVDLVELSAVRNPYLLDNINRNRELVYAT